METIKKEKIIERLKSVLEKERKDLETINAKEKDSKDLLSFSEWNITAKLVTIANVDYLSNLIETIETLITEGKIVDSKEDEMIEGNNAKKLTLVTYIEFRMESILDRILSNDTTNVSSCSGTNFVRATKDTSDKFVYKVMKYTIEKSFII